MLRGCLLAINHEDEVPIHPRGIQEYHHEFLSNSFEHICVCRLVQCKFSSYILWFYLFIQFDGRTVELECFYLHCFIISSVGVLCLASDVLIFVFGAGERIPNQCDVWNVRYILGNGCCAAATTLGGL